MVYVHGAAHPHARYRDRAEGADLFRDAPTIALDRKVPPINRFHQLTQLEQASKLYIIESNGQLAGRGNV